jgi:hypothetical protein
MVPCYPLKLTNWKVILITDVSLHLDKEIQVKLSMYIQHQKCLLQKNAQATNNAYISGYGKIGLGKLMANNSENVVRNIF